MNVRTACAALAAAALTMLPAVQSHAQDLPHLTEYTMTITMDQDAQMPHYSPPKGDVYPTVKRWNCNSAFSTSGTGETARGTYTVTCLPKLPTATIDADLPDVCQPGVSAAIVSLVPGNNVSGTATCGTSSASCTAYAVLPSPNFHGDCHLDAPAPVPGTSVTCAASWPLVQINTAWSVSCHDHA